MIKRYLPCTVMQLFFATQECFAADGPAAGVDLFSASIKMISMLALVVGIMLAITYLLKKVNIFGKSIIRSQKSLEVIETLYLGPKKNLALVRVGSECILVGITPNNISFLKDVENDYAVARDQGAANSSGKAFDEMLSTSVSELKMHTGKTVNTPDASTPRAPHLLGFKIHDFFANLKNYTLKRYVQ